MNIFDRARRAVHRAGAVVALAAIMGSAHGAAAQSSVSVTRHSGHDIKLELDKTEIVAGEPVFIKLTMTNVEQPMRLGNVQVSFYYGEGNDLRVMVQPPGEIAYRYTGSEENALQSSVEIALEIGESEVYQQMMLYDRRSPNGYVFGKAGEYLVGVSLSHGILRDVRKTQSVLGPVKVTVREPEGEAAEAFKRLASPAVALCLQNAFTTDSAVLATVKEVADKYPQSPYGATCRYALAAHAMEESIGNYSGAISEYARFLKDYPGHARTSDVLFSIAYCYDKLGKAEVARGWIYFLKDHDPSYRLLRAENPLASKYYYGLLEEGAKRRWWNYEMPWSFTPKEPAY